MLAGGRGGNERKRVLCIDTHRPTFLLRQEEEEACGESERSIDEN